MIHPWKCPVCGGTGQVPNGLFSGTMALTDGCRACEGTGIVWKPKGGLETAHAGDYRCARCTDPERAGLHRSVPADGQAMTHRERAKRIAHLKYLLGLHKTGRLGDLYITVNVDDLAVALDNLDAVAREAAEEMRELCEKWKEAAIKAGACLHEYQDGDCLHCGIMEVDVTEDTSDEASRALPVEETK